MGVVGRLDQYASILATEFDEISVNKFSISVGGTCYSNEFVENVDIPYISNIYPAYNIVDGLFAEVSSGIGLSYPNPTLSANVFAPYDPVSGEFASVSYGPGQGSFMRRDYLGDLIVYNEIDEISDFRDIVRSGLVLDLDAGMNASYNGTGTTWTDLSGNGNTGTLVNGVGYSASNGGALTFDGVNDYVNFPGTASGILDFGTGNFSLCCWIKPGSGIDSDGIINKRSGGRGYRLDIYSSQGIRMLVVGDAGVTVAANQIYTTGTWYYVVGVAENNTLKLYVNSILQTQTAIYSGTLSNSAVLEIGRMDQSNALSLDASVAQVSIYNKALTATEVSQNYNALKHRFGL